MCIGLLCFLVFDLHSCLLYEMGLYNLPILLSVNLDQSVEVIMHWNDIGFPETWDSGSKVCSCITCIFDPWFLCESRSCN